VGTKTPGSQTISGNGSGYSERPSSSSQGFGGAGGSGAAGSVAGGLLLGRPGVVPASARFAAATCWGEVPQQPPTICAPSARQASASSAYSSGPMRGSNRHPASE